MSSIRNFRDYNRGRPCPLCSGVTDCRQSLTTGAVFCRRTPAPPPGWRYGGDDPNGFGVFFADDGITHDLGPRATADKHREAARRAERKRVKEAATATGVSRRDAVESLAAPPVSKFDRFRAELRQADDNESRVLANVLRLPPSCFPSLDMQFLPASTGEHGPAWCFPERDGSGSIIGYGVRFHRDPRRPDFPTKQARGSRGIYIPSTLTDADLDDPLRPLVCPEGASDVLALVSVGVDTIGRSAAKAGAEYVGTWLVAHDLAAGARRSSKPIVILAESDLKPNGDWPGLAGARETARIVAGIIGRVVLVAFPPHGSKDARDAILYYADLMRSGAMSPADVGQIFVDAVMERNEAIGPHGAISESMVPAEPTGGDLVSPLAAGRKPMDGVRAVDAVVELPATRFGLVPCDRGPSLVLFDPSKGQMGVSRLSCKSSGKCPTCLSFKRLRHQEQVQFHLSQHKADVYRTYVANEGYRHGAARRIQRDHLNYFAILENGVRSIVSTDRLDDTSAELRPDMASGYLCLRLGRMMFAEGNDTESGGRAGVKAFTWSRPWRPLDEAKDKRWTVLANGELRMGDTMRVLDDHSIDFRAAKYTSQGYPIVAVFFDAPELPKDRSDLVEDILTGEIIPDIADEALGFFDSRSPEQKGAA